VPLRAGSGRFGDIGSLFERLEQAREADVRIDQQRTSGPRGAW